METLPLLSNDEIRALITERVDDYRLSVGISLGITERGQHHFVSYGYRDRTERTPVDADTIFEIGSVTKLFTVLLLADMAQSGEVSPQDPVAQYLPPHIRVPSREERPITLAHLALHTSGLPRIPSNLAAAHSDNPYAGYTADMLYEFLGSHELVRPSGQVEEYSNLGMGLLGHALALCAGTDYETLVKARVCEPLGLTNTSITLSQSMAEALATGHDDSLDPVPNWDLGVLAGAGGLRSNVRDLLTFLQTFGAETSPLAAAIQLFSAPVEEGGLGRLAAMPAGYHLVSHEGHTGGYNAYVGYIPQWERGVAILSNGHPTAAADLGGRILDQRYGGQWFRREAEVEPSQFDRLVGAYRMRPHFVVTIMREGDRLFAQATNQRRYRLFPASPWHYFYKVVGAQITFEPGPDGQAARLILHQNSRDQIAVRIA